MVQKMLTTLPKSTCFTHEKQRGKGTDDENQNTGSCGDQCRMRSEEKVRATRRMGQHDTESATRSEQRRDHDARIFTCRFCGISLKLTRFTSGQIYVGKASKSAISEHNESASKSSRFRTDEEQGEHQHSFATSRTHAAGQRSQSMLAGQRKFERRPQEAAAKNQAAKKRGINQCRNVVPCSS